MLPVNKKLLLPIFIVFPSLAFSQDYTSCVSNINHIAKEEYDFRDFKCAAQKLFFGDKEIDSISCTDALGKVFSQPQKMDDGSYTQVIKGNGQELTVSYDEQGRPKNLINRKTGSFTDNFFAQTIELKNFDNNCFVHRYMGGVPKDFRNVEFDTVACADWVLYNQKNPNLKACMNDLEDAFKLYKKHFDGDFTKGSTFFESSVSKTRRYISFLDENCRKGEQRWNAKGSIETAIKYLEKEEEKKYPQNPQSEGDYGKLGVPQ